MNTLAFLSSLALFTLPVSAADAPAGGPAKPETATPGATSSPEWRQQVSDAAGRQSAFVVKASSFPIVAGIEPTDLRVALIRKSLVDSLKNMPQPRKEDFQKLQEQYGKAFDQYQKINSARQSVIEKRLMEIHAKMPGVTVLENGIHYEVRKSDKPEENFPLSEVNWAKIGSTTITIMEIKIHTDLFSWIGDLLETVPDGKEWIFYVPAELAGYTGEQGVKRFVFSKRDDLEAQDPDSDDDSAEHPGGTDPDIEDEE